MSEAAPLSILAVFIVGALAGGGVAWWFGRSRSVVLRERLAFVEERLIAAEPLAAESQELRTTLAEERAMRRADAQRLAWIHTADEQLRMSFEALSQRALERSGSQQQERLSHLVAPLERGVAELGTHVRQLEKERQGAYQGLRQEIQLLREAHEQLRGSADGLRQALRSPSVRGRWGEVQLRRLVDMAGMVEHVDFVEQTVSEGGLRPDMVVRLPDQRVLPIDAKTPMGSYLKAMEAVDAGDRRHHAERHLKSLRLRAGELGGKAYWRQLEGSPDFAVMFLPHEGCLSLAFERDPDLLDFCMAQRVLPATPVTLLALLKSVSWGWRQQTVARNATQIAEAGRELHQRLIPFIDHLRNLGRGLESAVGAYNSTLGSLERRVLPAARRLEDRAAAPDPLPEPQPVDVGLRQPVSLEPDDKVPPVASRSLRSNDA